MKKRVMMLGQKESFLIRVLMGKVKGAGLECRFVPLTVNEINASWEGTTLVCLFLEEGEAPQGEVLHFLIDKLQESNLQMVTIGEKNDIDEIAARIPKDLIYRNCVRPVNNDEFVQMIVDLFDKIDAGDFKRSILIVDDDPNFLALAREWLKAKYKVSMANSGLQAIKWLGKNKADLILLDHEMPVTSGPQVLEMLRSDNETKNIPVMFLTGKGDKASVMAVLDLKPEGYFLKTMGKDELLEKLDEFFIMHR